MSGPVLILAHGWDLAARALAGAFRSGEVALVTPASLARQGFGISLQAGALTAAAAATPRAIVTLLPAVMPHDLPQIDPPDRDYVAAEMTAFLLGWLHASPSPKLNPPSFTALNGDLHPLCWRALAMAAGLRVPAFDPSWTSPMAAMRVSLIGETAIGGTPAAQDAARAMAAAARLSMIVLDVDVDEGGFVAAGAFPDVSAPDVLTAILDWCRA